LIAEFNVRSNGRAFIKASTASSQASIEPQAPGIKALSGKAISELKVLGPEDAAPRGCAVFVISADIVAMVDVAAGITDINAEISKLRKKLQKSQTTIEKQNEVLTREGFEEKVSEVVRSAEKQKLADAEAATENYKRTIEEFEKLSLGSA
jgi:valyl-tRNA synthetase